MKSKSTLIIASVLLVLVMLMGIVGCSTKAPASAPAEKPPTSTASPDKNKVYKLTFSSFNSAEDNKSKVISKWWFKWLNEESGGRIEVTSYFDAQAAAPQDQITAAKNHIVDIAEPASHGSPGSFPLNDLIALPFVFDWPSSRAFSLTQLALLEKYPQLRAEIEDQGVKLLGSVQCASPSELWAADKPIKVPNDIKGMVLHCWGQMEADALKLCGAAPETFAPGEVYDALSKGVIDGTMDSYVAASLVFGHIDKVNYGIEINLSNVYWMHVMNLDTWNSLPSDLQELFIGENARRITELWGYQFEQDDSFAKDVANKQLSERGKSEVYVPTAAEMKLWRDAVVQVKDAWVKRANELGAPGEDMWNDLLKFAEQYSYKNYPTQDWYLPTLQKYQNEVPLPDHWK